MTKQMLSICLAFVLLLGTLAGCSKNKTKTDNSSQNTQQETIPGAGVSIRLSTAVF